MTFPGIADAVDRIAAAETVVVTTGAGMSKESGIPTFRDAPNALWEKYDPMDLATPEGFARDPALVWRWYADRRQAISAANPHDGHRALAQLEALEWADFLVVTQNIDNLHRIAGTSQLVEIHGNIFRFKCFDHGHPAAALPDTDDVPPLCHCGSFLRPDVVWFGEMLPMDGLDRTLEAVAACEVMLVVGTSGIVYPAAGFPAEAARSGATVIEINPEPSSITPVADIFIRATAGEALPAIAEAVTRRRSGQR